MACASRLYPRAKPRGFTLHWINNVYYNTTYKPILIKYHSINIYRLKQINLLIINDKYNLKW